MTDEQIKHMVERFLALNLLDYTQTEAMVRHMVEGMPDQVTLETLTAYEAGDADGYRRGIEDAVKAVQGADMDWVTGRLLVSPLNAYRSAARQIIPRLRALASKEPKK